MASLAAVALAVACSGKDFESGGPGSGACTGDQVECGGQCVSSSDPAFGCGSCIACALDNATAQCAGGSCVVESCQAGFGDCSSDPGCEANLNSAASCGQCGVSCAPGQVCDQGKCADSCPPTKQQCGSSCVDPQTDVLHCGACDASCQTVANALSVCNLGSCGLACNSGFLDCDGQRETGCEINSQFDPSHCGSCGHSCEAGESCLSGQCVLSCGGGSTECSGQCVDLQTDEANCGDCDKACASGQNCVAGACKLNCSGGTTECNGACADTKIDPNNCGGCGQVCGAGYQCTNGACEPKCAVAVPVEIFREEFNDNSKGWLLDSPWGIKSATSSSGHTYGFPDPASDVSSSTNNGVAGVVVGGNVPKVVNGFLNMTSPVVNTAAVTSLFLGYSRWLNSDFEPYMKSTVQVFNGTSWVTIWQTAASPSVTDDGWVEQSFEITQYKNANLQVRFGYKIGDPMVYTVSGWNVDDVTLTAVTCN